MFTESQLKAWIEDKLKNGKKSLSTSIRNSKEIQNSLLFHTIDHKDLNFSARALLVLLGKRPLCKNEDCNNFTYYRDFKFGATCSVKCAANVQSRKDKISNTCLKKYGVDNYTKTDKFKSTIDKEWMSSDEFKKKSKETIMKKYNVDHYSKTKMFKENLKKHNQNSYGVDYYMQTDEFRKKSIDTCIEKYGVSNPMQNLDIFEKQQNNSYYYKDYILPSGKIIRLQGYENLAMNELLKNYNEEEIIVSNKEIFSLCGKFEYIYNEKTHVYFPDIYIPSDNLIIEVKSTRTFSVNKSKNLEKMKTVTNKGYSFEFWIYGNDTKQIIKPE